MMAVWGIGMPSGWRNSAVTANQSAMPPTKPALAAACSRSVAVEAGQGVAAECQRGHQDQQPGGEGAVAAQRAAGFGVGVRRDHGRLRLPRPSASSARWVVAGARTKRLIGATDADRCTRTGRAQCAGHAIAGQSRMGSWCTIPFVSCAAPFAISAKAGTLVSQERVPLGSHRHGGAWPGRHARLPLLDGIEAYHSEQSGEGGHFAFNLSLRGAKRRDLHRSA